MSVAAPPMPAMPEVAPFVAAFERDDSGASHGNAHGSHATPADQASHSESPSTGRYTATNGNLAEEVVADGDRHCALAIHLSPLAFVWIGPFALAIPLVIWLVRKDQSAFVDDHGRETTNFMMTFVLLHVLLAITVVGILLIPVLWVAAIIGMIRGAVAANRNEYFRYPVTIRFL